MYICIFFLVQRAAEAELLSKFTYGGKLYLIVGQFHLVNIMPQHVSSGVGPCGLMVMV